MQPQAIFPFPFKNIRNVNKLTKLFFFHLDVYINAKLNATHCVLNDVSGRIAHIVTVLLKKNKMQ